MQRRQGKLAGQRVAYSLFGGDGLSLGCSALLEGGMWAAGWVFFW